MKKHMHNSLSFRIRLICLIVLGGILFHLPCANASENTKWHIFEKIPFLTGYEVPSYADRVMHKIECTETVNNVEISVREAGYDGRTLLILCGYKILDAKEAYGMTAEAVYGDQLPKGTSKEDFVIGVNEAATDTLEEHRVGWWMDHIWLDGEAIGIPNASGFTISGTAEPGELLFAYYFRLDNSNIGLKDKTRISLPIGEMQDLSEYSKQTHPERFDGNGNVLLPEKGVVTFTLDAGDILSEIAVVQPGQLLVLPEVAAQVHETVFSPLMTYIKLDLDVNPEAMEAFFEQHGEGILDDQGNLLVPFGGMDVFGAWVQSLELVDKNGTLIFPDVYGIEGVSNTEARFVYPHLENPPEELYLAPIESSGTDMSRALPVYSARQE